MSLFFFRAWPQLSEPQTCFQYSNHDNEGQVSLRVIFGPKPNQAWRTAGYHHKTDYFPKTICNIFQNSQNLLTQNRKRRHGFKLCLLLLCFIITHLKADWKNAINNILPSVNTRWHEPQHSNIQNVTIKKPQRIWTKKKTLLRFTFATSSKLFLYRFKTFRFACFVYKNLHGLQVKQCERHEHQGLWQRRLWDSPQTRHVWEEHVCRRVGLGGSLPSPIRKCPTCSYFKGNLKQWLKSNQMCDHYPDLGLLVLSLYCFILIV